MNKMALILSGLLLVSIMMMPVAIAEPTATVSIGNYELLQGENITAPIRIDGLTGYGLGAATIVLSYDHTVVEVIYISGDITQLDVTFLYHIDNPTGTTRMVFFIADLEGPTGDVIFANVTLRAIGYGGSTSPLDITVETLVNPHADLIGHMIVDGVFTVLNQPPVAMFTHSPPSPYVYEVVTFNATDSSDPDGYIVSWNWDFGDGTTGSGEVVTHSYAQLGNYVVALTVTDNHGLSITSQTTVTVTRPPEPPIPGFGAIFAILGLLAVVYLTRRKR